MRIELPVERYTAYHSVFSCVRNITIGPNSSNAVNEASTVSLVRKATMLEAGGSSTIFLCEN
jgi:hypothetical protein